jgi:uncharacterized protein (DUF983 family)
MIETPENDEKISFLSDVKIALKGVCPKCRTGHIFATPTALNPQEHCPRCGFHLGAHDNGDGPAVFLIFILGFLIVPLALVSDAYFTIALWVHGVLWTAISLLLCVLSLRPLKAYIMLLQYRHLPKTYGEDDKE